MARPRMRTPICGLRTPSKCACSVRWREWNNLSCKKRWHGWRGIFSEYSQQDHKLHQRYRGRHTYELTRQLQSGYATRAPGKGGYCQEDDIQPAWPNRNRVICSRGTRLIFWHHWDLIHATSGSQHFLRNNPQDGQVRAVNSRVELNDGNTEDVGAIKTVFLTSHQNLKETSNLIVEDAGIHRANMVRDVVSGIQEALQQDQFQTDTPTVM